ncbi:nucleoside hydrolase [Salidesulfovibrio brasiliensis]
MLACRMTRHPKPIILDMDNGCGIPLADVDDALALAVALASPELRIAACTACAGNCRTVESARNTLFMLELARQDIPVALGPETPLARERRAHFRYLDDKRRTPERRLWDRVPRSEPQGEPDPRPAHVLMAECAAAEPDGLTLVCTGSLTNAAMLVREFPDEAARVREIIHMGGAFPDTATDWENSTPDIPPEVWRDTLRFNPLFDPEAAAAVFESGIPVTVVPANVTMQVFLRPGDIAPLEDCGRPFGEYLHAACMPWLRWSMKTRKLPGAHLHDPLALALAFAPDICTYREMLVDMDTLLKPDGTFLRENGNGPTVRVASGVDIAAAETLVGDRLRVFGNV